MKRQQTYWRAMSIFPLLLALGGCQQEQKTEQLQRWLAQTKDESMRLPAPEKPLVPLPPVADFQAFPYLVAQANTPFGAPQVIQAHQRIDEQAHRPPQRGAPQLLESFALDAIAMVGVLIRGTDHRAVVNVAGQLYQVGPGDYLGQAYGVIETISETSVTLQELARDMDGVWIAHKAQLTMEDGTR